MDLRPMDLAGAEALAAALLTWIPEDDQLGRLRHNHHARRRVAAYLEGVRLIDHNWSHVPVEQLYAPLRELRELQLLGLQRIAREYGLRVE